MKTTLLTTAGASLLSLLLINPASAGTVITDGAPHVSTTGGGADDSADSAADIAKKLSNPLAAMISVPFQNNFDFGGGPNGDGFQYKLNFQPVIPFDFSENWNLISRTIIPFISQEDIIGTSSQDGLSDIVQSVWFSPKKPTDSGWIWGVGPVFLLPTATDDLLGTEKWGAGPTFVALRQSGGWTYGGLVNHIWSYAGEDDRSEVNSTYMQPFLNYNTPSQTTFALNSESTYDWTAEQWIVPINASIKQMGKIGSTPIQLELGARYYAERPTGGPDWGLRMSLTFILPQ